jgi:hypothetical protein
MSGPEKTRGLVCLGAVWVGATVRGKAEREVRGAADGVRLSGDLYEGTGS